MGNYIKRIFIFNPCIRTNNKIANFIIWLPYNMININNIINIGPLMIGIILSGPIVLSYLFIIVVYLFLALLILIFTLIILFIAACVSDTLRGILTFGGICKGYG